MSDPMYVELNRLGKALAGARILHINATSKGGGVAELLHSELPLQRDLGLLSSWKVLQAPGSFFEITKKIHNGLQGDAPLLSHKEWSDYESLNAALASHIKSSAYDLIVIHDPQPLAIPAFIKNRQETKWVWRCHIDLEHSVPDYSRHVVSFLKYYDAGVFTKKSYIPSHLKMPMIADIPVAIDPLSDKNQYLAEAEAKNIVRSFGIDMAHPLIVQISRFDPWKDPVGVIKAFRLARKKTPAIQLALIGETAADDPQGEEILRLVKEEAAGDKDIFIIADQADAKAVKAFQMLATIVLQKSLREGFGLTVAEAMWAGRPVIGGDVGGIPLQIQDGKTGFLVSSVPDTARAIVRLINSPELADEMGASGKAYARQNLLLPRMLRDDLRLYAETLGVKP